jgi:hypothetical protein
MKSHIDELKDTIRRLHGVDSSHVETVAVKESFEGETIWEGEVEVFELYDHPETDKLYAWVHEMDDIDNPKRHVTVLHIDPITSPQLAVRAAIIQEYRKRERPKEN